MKIKISSLKVIYIYLFSIFIIMKVWRAFSGSEKHGGAWNYIQIFFVIVGLITILKFLNYVKREPAIFFLEIYSIIAVFVSIITIRDVNTSNLFEIVKIPFAGMITVIFYIYGLNKQERYDKNLIIKVTFYISSVILCYRLGQHMLRGGIRASGAGAVADVYFILGLLPYILAVTEKKRQIIPIVVTATSVFMSQKRAGFIALVFAVVLFYLVGSSRDNKVSTSIKKIVILTAIIIGGYYLMVFMDSYFNLRLFIRLRMLETDGGAGRDIKWRFVIEAIKSSNVVQLFFGHGFNGVKYLMGQHAHNDFLEVMYNYGFFALLFYFLFFFAQFYNGVRMVKDGYSHSGEFISSMVITLCIAMFSYYVIDATYAICGCFAQSIFLADWRQKQFEDCPNNDRSVNYTYNCKDGRVLAADNKVVLR